MKFKLDHRQPLVVIVGFWNSTILMQPGWIAKHILKLDEGHEIEISILSQQDQSKLKNINMYEKFGISCFDNRLELYRSTGGTHEDLYNLINNLVGLLPHTPISAIGVNFNLVAEHEISIMTQAIETKENFDSFGIIKHSTRTDTIEISRNNQLNTDGQRTYLNISRQTDYITSKIDFNFHQEIYEINSLKLWTDQRPIEKWKELKTNFLSQVYDAEIGDDIFY